MHPEIMHPNAINNKGNTKVLDFITRSIIFNIGTFLIKFMQKLCKNNGKSNKIKDISRLAWINTSPNQGFRQNSAMLEPFLGRFYLMI